MHTLLLQLPWTDVFTTNYDTLLERTEIPWRNYQPVIKPDELPTSFAPRIVKLHGSFPSQTPFIIAEEDYRTYPRRFAPFVNTVQQALLENCFVLLGFSGNDPNFLAWTGWIRDELGEKHAPIYLVGPLFLGNAERQLLNRRGVTPIDLAPLFPDAPRGQIHALCIEWFLKCLAAAKPERPDSWPEFNESTTISSPGFPPLFGAREKAPEEIPLSPDPQKPLSNEAALRIITRWQFERRKYPGWLILPHQKRRPLWNNTKYWLPALFSNSKQWSAAERILLFREINWRLEVAMVPLFEYMVKPFEEAANEVHAVLATGKVPTPSGQLFEGAAEAEVLNAWMEIMFGLLREAREMYNETRWKALKDKINGIVPHHREFEDQNHYEDALWSIWNVKREEAIAKVARWQPSPFSPLGNMRKAGLLAELDELGESQPLLRGALLEVRRALRTHGQNIQLLSLEGWITYLIFAVEQAKDFRQRASVREEFRERWQELKAWDCSPWDQKQFFEQELAVNPPTMGHDEQEIIGFDPGHVSFSKNYAGDIDNFLPAFACIRLYEQVGVPMRLPSLKLGGDALKRACYWIAPFIGLWSPALLVRAGNIDDLTKDDLFLTRTKIAAMPTNVAQRLHTWSLDIFEKELSSLGGGIRYNSAQESILKALPEVISRLAFKVTEAELRRSFHAALRACLKTQ